MDGSISIANNQIKEQTTLSFVANLSVIHKRRYKQEAIMGLQSTRHTEYASHAEDVSGTQIEPSRFLFELY